MIAWLRRLRPHAGRRHAPVAEGVEPRLLFSADLAAGLMLGADAAATAEVRTLTSSGEYATATAPASSASTVAATYAALPMSFEANEGQAAAGIDFVAHGGGYGVALDNGNAWLTLATESGQRTVQLQLVGARDAVGEGEGLLATRSNYIVGSDPSKWATDLANHGAVAYRGVYDGIDVRYYGNQRQLEYDFIVGAGADAGQIRLQFEGVEGASIAANGDLLLRVQGTDTDLRFQAPVSYQRAADGTLQAVASSYQVHEDGSIGFVLGEYDASRELVIDPVLAYASYFGGSSSEVATDVVVGADGYVYVTGRTTSGSFPSDPDANELPGNGGRGNGDVFVAKFSADLSQVIWSTRIGGSADEQANAIAVDANGNVAVTGWTRSSNFPTLAADDGSLATPLLSTHQDAFVLKLDTNGGLVFSTYFGGNGTSDAGNAVAFDAAGNVYAAGLVSSEGLLSLPLLSDLLAGSDNAFINKYTASGEEVYKRLLGGSGDDFATGLAVTAAGEAYVVGSTRSGTLALNADTLTVNGHDGAQSGTIDGFLVRLNAAGGHVYSTFIGGSDNDSASAVAIDGNGNAYVVGETKIRNSGNLETTTGAFQQATSAANDDTVGFLRVYDTDVTGAGNGMLYSSLLGHANGDRPTDVAYARDRVVIVGQSNSDAFPTTADAAQSDNENRSLFVMMIRPAGAGTADLEYGTFYGKEVTPGGIAVHGRSVYVVGGTAEPDYGFGAAPHKDEPDASDALVAGFTNMLPNAAPVLTDDTRTIAEDQGVAFPGNGPNSLLANDADPDGDALQIVSVTSGVGGVATLNTSSGVVQFTPAANFHGTATFTYTVSDGTTTSTATVRITVTPVNDSPITSNVVLGPLQEDTSRTITQAELLANASDVDLDALTVTSLVASSGTLTNLGGGVWSYTPASNDDTAVTFTYTVGDGTATTTGTASLDLTPVNDAPTTANVDLGSLAEDGTRTITEAQLLGGAADIDGGPLSVSNLVASSGTLTNLGGGVWSYTPGSNDDSAVTFTYEISDGTATVAGTASLELTPVNDAPTTSEVDLGSLAEDGALIITPPDLLQNASDLDLEPLTITGLAATNGTITANVDGTWTFRPAAHFNGTVTFTYGVSDGTENVAGSASLEVTPVNDAPTTSPVTIDDVVEDGELIITQADLLQSAADVDLDALTITGLTASNGTITSNADGTWTFRPGADFNGTVTFTYGVSDGTETVAGSASLEVTPVNDAPTTAPVTLDDVTEDGELIITPADLLQNAGDVDLDALTITGLTASNGTITSNADGTWTFRPAANFNGTVTFTYGVTDGTEAVAGSASLEVTPVNDAPTTGPVTLDDVAEDGELIITPADLLQNAGDAELDGLAITGLSASNGTITANADGTWTFRPAANFNGTVTFTYGVSDGTETVAGSASLEVTPVNDAPTTSPVTLADLAEDGALIITPADLLQNAGDVDLDALTITGLTATNGTITANADGTWTFRPAANFNGTVTFTYGVSDGTDTTPGSASLEVTPVNDAPTSAPVTLDEVAEDGALIITPADLLQNAGDVDLDALTITALTASNGTITANADGTWTFRPAANFNGTVTFTYGVSDGTDTTPGFASLEVTPVNDAPTTSPVTLTDVAEDGALIITPADLLQNAADVDLDALTITAVSASNGTITANADGTWTFRPAANFNGTVTFTYVVSDGTESVAGSASLQVTPVDDAPVGGADTLAGVEDTPLTIAPGSLVGNDSDIEGAPLSIVAVQAGTGGTVVLNADGSITFRPDAGFHGTASFSYTLADGTLTTLVPVTVNVAPQDLQTAPSPPPPPPVVEPPPAEPPAPAPAPGAGSPVPEPAPPSGPAAPPLPPVTAAPAEGGGSVAPRPPRAAESLQDALGGGMESPTAALNAAEMAFGAPAATVSLQAEGSRPSATVVFDRAGLQLISAQGTDFALRSFGVGSGSEGTRLEDFQRSIRSAAFASELDRLREAVREELDLEGSVSISVVSVSLGLSFVYVLWLIRGGVLLGSYLSALPAWRILDPLPVLARGDDEADEEDEALAVERPGSRSTLRGFG